jgi:endonuclease III
MCKANHEVTLSDIRQALLDYASSFDPADLFPTVVPEAAKLIASDPFAFLIACCLNRGARAEVIWTIPFDIKNFLGHLDPFKIYRMSLDELAEMFTRLPRRPRYVNDAPFTLKELTRIVVEECDGDASNIWRGKRSAEVNRTLDSVFGVGQGIANMTVLLIELANFGQFDAEDHKKMNIKPDIQTKRVLYRLGVAEEESPRAALEAARKINPDFPGEIDGALWMIGREFCHPTNPNCPECPVTCVCKKRFE